MMYYGRCKREGTGRWAGGTGLKVRSTFLSGYTRPDAGGDSRI